MLVRLLESLGGIAFNMKECETSIKKTTVNNKDYYVVVCDFDILKITYKLTYTYDVQKQAMSLFIYRIHRNKSVMLVSENTRYNGTAVLNKKYIEDLVHKDARSVLKVTRLPREKFLNLDNDLCKNNKYTDLIQEHMYKENTTFIRFASTETPEKNLINNLRIKSEYSNGDISYLVDISYANNTTIQIHINESSNFHYKEEDLINIPVRELLPILLNTSGTRYNILKEM